MWMKKKHEKLSFSLLLGCYLFCFCFVANADHNNKQRERNGRYGIYFWQRNKPLNKSCVCCVVVLLHGNNTHTTEWRLNSFDTVEKYSLFQLLNTIRFCIFLFFFYWSILRVFEKRKKEKNAKTVCVVRVEKIEREDNLCSVKSEWIQKSAKQCKLTNGDLK